MPKNNKYSDFALLEIMPHRVVARVTRSVEPAPGN